MENLESNTNYIARWLNGDLSEEERQSFEQTKEFEQYQKILSKADTLVPPVFEKQKMKAKLFEKISKNKEDVVSGENYIAKWLNDDLTQEERQSFEQTNEFKEYQKILSKADILTAPAFDKEKLKAKVLDEIEEKKNIKVEKPVRRLLPYWISGLAVAACVAIGFFLFSNGATAYQTGYGEQLTVSLPDGSEVQLNSKSELRYKEGGWDKERIVSLDGEAFFSVQKGSDFVVETNFGSVKVLGTQFNVDTKKNFLEVICHEGKVRVAPKNGTDQILTKGKAYRSIDGKEENWELKEAVPAWLSGETSCYNLPLAEVLKKLENQFNVIFITDDIDIEKRFTGSYTQGNIALALKTICIPMEIDYKVEKGNRILLTNKK